MVGENLVFSLAQVRESPLSPEDHTPARSPGHRSRHAGWVLPTNLIMTPTSRDTVHRAVAGESMVRQI